MDVVELLVGQHAQIKKLFEEVIATSGRDREGAFFELRRLLAVHEAAEEQIVHPRTRRELGDGDLVADARLREERAAKQQIAELESLEVDTAEFVEKFAELRAAVLTHAQSEETEEFPRLRDDLEDKQLQRMATAVHLAESIAPTRPHPGIELAGEHLLAGPFAAMLDRARDVITKPRG
ncbi:MAG TPA: hemerythrin domain-containing protein [Jatrophihabitantaceae bacterium]